MSTNDFPPKSVEALYLEPHGWLKGWLRRSTGCSEQAADLAQDTFLRLLAGRSHEVTKHPRAMLQRVARNLLIDHWRRREVERAWLDSTAQLPASEVPSPETQALIVESLLRVEAALSRLPAQTRRVFELSQIDGLKQRAIANELNISPRTVRRQLRKALAACILAD